MSPLFSPLCSNIGCSLVVATYGDGEGVNIVWSNLGPESRGFSLLQQIKLGYWCGFRLKSGLLARSGDGMGYVYSPSISSHSHVEKMEA